MVKVLKISYNFTLSKISQLNGMKTMKMVTFYALDKLFECTFIFS